MSDWIYVIEIENIINTFIEENYIHVASGNSVNHAALKSSLFVLAHKAVPTHHN